MEHPNVTEIECCFGCSFEIYSKEVYGQLYQKFFVKSFYFPLSNCKSLERKLLTLTTHLENTDTKSVTIVAYDLSKAFDTVDHQLLLKKIAKLHPKLNGQVDCKFS